MKEKKIELIYLEDLDESEKTDVHKNRYQILNEEYEQMIDTYTEMSKRSSYDIVNERHKEDFKDELWDYDDTDYDDGLQGKEI
ncbi:TPA: hypothetical protein OL540_002864 [Clostridioides difficile]|nr:hypothetical protein [Clostridioides difficile]